MPSTTNDPILLPEDKHEQVKLNLAALLKDTFSIENQSDGKLEYLAARVMGFDNHQQRKALLDQRDQKLATFQALLRKPPELYLIESQWPAGVLREHNGEIPDDAFERLKTRGWFDQETGAEYRDLEIEFRYQGDNEHQEPSFNFRLSIDPYDKCVHFILGDNLGDGFNEHLAVVFRDWSEPHEHKSWRNSVSALKNMHRSSRAAVRFAEAFELHPDTADALLDEIEVITRYLSTGELPATR